MNFPFASISNSELETGLIAKKFTAMLKSGDVILLNGELGSGKTFFVKQICKEFKIDSAASPSFAIVNEYHNGKKIVHFDFYRIKKIEELYDIGFEEYFNDERIVFIEWSNMFSNILPKRNYQIEFIYINSTSREISIIKHE